VVPGSCGSSCAYHCAVYGFLPPVVSLVYFAHPRHSLQAPPHPPPRRHRRRPYQNQSGDPGPTLSPPKNHHPQHLSNFQIHPHQPHLHPSHQDTNCPSPSSLNHLYSQPLAVSSVAARDLDSHFLCSPRLHQHL